MCAHMNRRCSTEYPIFSAADLQALKDYLEYWKIKRTFAPQNNTKPIKQNKWLQKSDYNAMAARTMRFILL